MITVPPLEEAIMVTPPEADEILMVAVDDIDRCRWRDEEDSPEKVEANMDRLARQGWRGHLDGILHPNGRVEQLEGHNRKAAALLLGIKFIPFCLKPRTIAECRDIFLSSNLNVDGQSTGFALGAVRRMLPELVAEGMSQDEAIASVAKSGGWDAADVRDLYKMLAALDARGEDQLTSEIKRISPPRDGVECAKKMIQLMKKRKDKKAPLVTLAEQKVIVDKIVANPSPRTKIRTLFCELLSELDAPLEAAPTEPTPSFSFTPPITVKDELLKKISKASKAIGAILADDRFSNLRVDSEVLFNFRKQCLQLLHDVLPSEEDDNGEDESI